MIRPILRVSVLFVLSILFSIQGSTSLDRQLINQELSPKLNLDPDFGKIPLYLIPNEGQVNEKAIFYSKTSRYTLWLTKEGLIFDSSRKAESRVKEYGDKAKLDKHEKLGRNAERKESREGPLWKDVSSSFSVN